MRIGPEVVELPRGRRDAVVRAGHAEPVAVEEDQLVTVVADAHVRRAYFVLGPVTVIHAAGPLLRRVAREVAPETAALRLLRRFGSGIVGQQRCEIDVGDDVPVAGSGRNLLRVADHEGHAQRFLVHDPLVEESVLSEEVTLIRDVDHDRILRQPLFVERAEQTADVVVDRRGAAQVVAYEFLVDGPAVGDRIPLDAAERQFGVVGPPVLRIGVGLVPAPCHRFERLARERAARLRGAEFEQVFRFGEPHAVVKVREPLREIARFVRSLEVAEHRKGLRPVPLFDPADRLVGHQIGRESLFHRAAYALVVVHPVFGRLEYRVAVGALIVENAVIVESRWFLFQMPFADQRRPVAGLLQPLGDVVLFGTQCVVERVDAVQVAVLPGEDRGPARHRDRVGAERVVQHAPFGGKAGDVVVGGVRRQNAAVNAPALRGVVVRENEENIGMLLRRSVRASCGHGENSDGGRA